MALDLACGNNLVAMSIQQRSLELELCLLWRYKSEARQFDASVCLLSPTINRQIGGWLSE